MLKLRRFLIIILIATLLFGFLLFVTNSYATSINMNLAGEANVTDEGNPGNNLRQSGNTTQNGNNTATNSASNTAGLNTNTSASVQSVEQFEDTTSSFDVTNILNILLLAVGLVLILLAVAILIRLRK